jgi:hypothetical protein
MDELSRAFFQQHKPRQMDERPFVQDITNPKKKTNHSRQLMNNLMGWLQLGLLCREQRAQGSELDCGSSKRSERVSVSCLFAIAER